MRDLVEKMVGRCQCQSFFTSWFLSGKGAIWSDWRAARGSISTSIRICLGSSISTLDVVIVLVFLLCLCVFVWVCVVSLLFIHPGFVLSVILRVLPWQLTMKNPYLGHMFLIFFSIN